MEYLELLLSSKLKLPDLTPLDVCAWCKTLGCVPLGVDPLKVAGADQTSMVWRLLFLH